MQFGIEVMNMQMTMTKDIIRYNVCMEFIGQDVPVSLLCDSTAPLYNTDKQNDIPLSNEFWSGS